MSHPRVGQTPADDKPIAQAANAIHDVSSPTRSDIWCDDGNIILQVSMKQYKVHQSLLAMHSPVFASMFDIPQPAEQTLVEGCHIISLSDSVEDWDEFLPMLYNKHSTFDLRRNAMKSYAIPVKLMLAMLVLGHKYDFSVFRNQALQFLKICFPANLDDLEVFWFTVANNDRFAHDQILPHAFKIINVALKLGIETVLPAAFYICIVLRSTDSLLSGLDEPNRPPYLSYDTRHKLVLAKEWIQETMLNIIPLWTDIKPPCATEHECEQKFENWYSRLVASSSLWTFMSLDVHSRISSGELCGTCEGSFDEYARQTRQAAFVRFPSERLDLPEMAALEDGI